MKALCSASTPHPMCSQSLSFPSFFSSGLCSPHSHSTLYSIWHNTKETATTNWKGSAASCLAIELNKPRESSEDAGLGLPSWQAEVAATTPGQHTHHQQPVGGLEQVGEFMAICSQRYEVTISPSMLPLACFSQDLNADFGKSQKSEQSSDVPQTDDQIRIRTCACRPSSVAAPLQHQRMPPTVPSCKKTEYLLFPQQCCGTAGPYLY